ncbi:MAG: 6-hydroxymethylpterin diphosphokinase MptE-like protein, partial [Spirochaetota bacterium]|nr:6-hydroxymethylpterin diphosphokinase MptE-like protein [Spirochaetota bacterium]
MGQYRLEETKYGLQTLIYSNLREIRLHSVYDPKKEAERSIGNFKKGRANLIVVCGLGLGYHIDQLKKKYPDCFIIVAEKDVEVVNILNNTYPEHIQDVTIVNSSKDLPAIFEAIDISIVKGVSTYIHRPSYNIYNDFYDDILKDIKKYISSKISDLLTRFEFEEKWIENIMGNIHNIFCSTPVLDLFSKFKNYPGIIVSAGPSLAKNVKLLNNIRDKAIIVCVDTALKVL